ncbi:MAG: pseudouridine synthase, partial [Leadbetterella sp.]|nr:pseudouridine synthase [Leadbetterella sp.]
MKNSDTRLTCFSEDVLRDIPLPRRFTFPFSYEPHPLASLAAEELMDYLLSHPPADHNFGLDPLQPGPVIGKMFGVLVVQDTAGKTGYLCGFSGKLAGTNHHERFVPPVFDMLTENSFFLRGEVILNEINRKIEQMENHPDLLRLRNDLLVLTDTTARETACLKARLKANKEKRRLQREEQKGRLTPEDYTSLEEELVRQSIADKRLLHRTQQEHREKNDELTSRIDAFETQIEALKTERREKSAALQDELFSRYSFLNRHGKSKSLGAIFRETVYGKPPAAAGECATPKLLQYAFQQGYHPLAMAEFWWGAPPPSEIRKHRHYYPACTGKCEPILKHMLEDIPLDINPLLQNTGSDKTLCKVFEDEHIVVIDKPSGLLSVPGTYVKDSVYSRLKAMWLNRAPFMIHRLDMATSGLLVVARTREAHKHIQQQFLKRTVVKRYSALLSGEPAETD